MAFKVLQTPIQSWLRIIELWLEKERDQLPLWLPVALGCGIAAWFLLPLRQDWIGFIAGSLALAVSGPVLGWPRRLGRAATVAGLFMALGCGLAWARAELAQHMILQRPTVGLVRGLVERVEDRAAEDKMRLVVRTRGGAFPAHVRVTIRTQGQPPPIKQGMDVSFRARLAPPPKAALPGGYNFSRAAWFLGLGAVGQVLGEVTILRQEPNDGSLRQRLSDHVRAQIRDSEGGIASAFASGDRGGIAPEDEEAMRASGLTHLLSISGLHVTAVVAATMFLTLRLLALSTWLALRLPLTVISAAAGAGVGIGYTLLTGAEVPTVRSCIAALLVLLGMAVGREALTLRLVAAGALVVLLIWPESLVGASFQLSFAAITSIVAVHEIPRVKSLLARREEAWVIRIVRNLVGLLITGLVVEAVLAPIALFHFHKSGIFGALANLIAIPLTTFVVMPVEALALLFDLIGWGAPFWWLTGKSLSLLLWIARNVAAFPGAVALVPSVSITAFGTIVVGGLWLLLWSSKDRLLGFVPILVGLMLVAATPRPDILLTDDGRHMAVRGADGRMALLRERTGDFVRDVMAERAGETEIDAIIDDWSLADCSPDLCIAIVQSGKASWVVGATRSAHLVPRSDMNSLCAKLDVIVSERRLPNACKPRLLKADRPFFDRVGGLAITLDDQPIIETTKGGRDDHPWTQTPVRHKLNRRLNQYRRSRPASLP
jgi:competence protein ComEC